MLKKHKIYRKNNIKFFTNLFYASEKEFTQHEELLNFVNDKGQDEVECIFESIKTQGILQREIGFTNENSTKPILGSIGAGPCVILAAYNSESKTVLLAHIDSLTILTSLSQFLDKLAEECKNEKLQVHIRGGDLSLCSMHKVASLIDLLKQRDDVEIVSGKVGTNDYDMLAIDAATGKIFTRFKKLYFSEENIENNSKLLMQSDYCPLKLSFDDRNSVSLSKNIQ